MRPPVGGVGQGFDFFPGVRVVYVNLPVVRRSGEQWLGRMESDGQDPCRSMVSKGFDFFAGVKIVYVDLAVGHSSNYSGWVGWNPMEMTLFV